MATTGEKPGAGTYTCDNCGQVVVLDDNTDTLPPCPKCNVTEFHYSANVKCWISNGLPNHCLQIVSFFSPFWRLYFE